MFKLFIFSSILTSVCVIAAWLFDDAYFKEVGLTRASVWLALKTVCATIGKGAAIASVVTGAAFAVELVVMINNF